MEIVEHIDEVENNLPDLFTKEELDNAVKYDPEIDYRKELIEKYETYEIENNEGLDDYIEDKDKVALIRYCDTIVKKNYKEYPSPMDEILVKKMYYETIKNMNKEDYLKEKKEQNELSTLEKELQKIKDETNIEYALKELENN